MTFHIRSAGARLVILALIMGMLGLNGCRSREPGESTTGQTGTHSETTHPTNPVQTITPTQATLPPETTAPTEPQTEPIDPALAMDALNELLIGVPFFPGAQGLAADWSDSTLANAVYCKLLWDGYSQEQSTCLYLAGLKSHSGEEDFLLYFDLEWMDTIARDAFGREFPRDTHSDLIVVSGNEVSVMPAIGESSTLMIQNLVQQGDTVLAVGISVHNDNAGSTFNGCFRAAFRINPDSLYGFTLVSIEPLAQALIQPVLTAEASSALVESHTTHGPWNVLDGDPGTTWCEDASGRGIGEWLRLETEDGSPVPLCAVSFALGFQGTDALLRNNGWPTRILIECEDGFRQEAEFYSYNDVVMLDRPVTTEWIKITILDARAGTLYEDTCISDITLLGVDSQCVLDSDVAGN